MMINEEVKKTRLGDSKLENRMYKTNLKIRSYRAIKEDYTHGFLECPNHPMMGVSKYNEATYTTRSFNKDGWIGYRPDNFISLFKIERKFIQIIEAVNRRESYLLVKTTESFI